MNETAFPASGHERPLHLHPRGREIHRLGGILAIVGGLGYAVTLLLHGNLPDQTTAVALEHIAGRPEWRYLKLALVAFVTLWVGAFIALAASLRSGPGWLLGRLAVASTCVGVAVVVVEYAIIGHELKGIADAWAAAEGAAAAELHRLAETLLAVSNGLFHSFVALLLGLPFLLFGLAMLGERDFPRWLGPVAVVAGGGALLAGATRFVGLGLVPYPLLYGGFVLPLNVWLVAVGVLMLRRARRL